MVGNIGVKDIYVNSYINAEDIIKPTENKKYLIEFIGDSITCGYGIEGKGANEMFDTSTENFEKTYAYLSAKELNYDYSTVCYSGCGIITPGSKMTERYKEINSFMGDLEWDFNAARCGRWSCCCCRGRRNRRGQRKGRRRPSSFGPT